MPEDQQQQEGVQIDTQAVFEQLQASPEGRNELEKAVQRAQIAALQEQVAALSANGQGAVPDDYDIHDD